LTELDLVGLTQIPKPPAFVRITISASYFGNMSNRRNLFIHAGTTSSALGSNIRILCLGFIRKHIFESTKIIYASLSNANPVLLLWIQQSGTIWPRSELEKKTMRCTCCSSILLVVYEEYKLQNDVTCNCVTVDTKKSACG